MRRACAALAVAFIVSCAAMILYRLHLAGERPDAFASLAAEVVRRLPALCESLPPTLLDRLTHHVHILEIIGASYRLKSSLDKGKGKQ